ncbi:DUF4238 domain-containing protein [Agrobacterium rubi]|uniref:DUF4238 domain-containing protein n=1 Tax=Agrobacterium rubi TaxID=28099 RepID=A0AAE7UNR4_9HYPH|nr:DUF4238 domain-containing protein [Agrobacterium rubi]NTE86010.1 DUF4238 domain-containing protein [Agrobacterium rubi]NTF01941.1 DUF4238 domain-containing protein [Agrobacterium rubi]NTF36185.1 DUF4238 domain-containing protein [Agrobacterium rubi]OCJ54644.1 hypothetical protein A6U92_21630 [Agrobacterium rubi]QTG01268.1 DUF4238 domain-containing protein [Agrobacterium rubi]
MAGRGQHFIPRHFQKPFVISETQDKIWLYRRGMDKPVPVSRNDAGKEHDFYSAPSANGDPTLDDLITEYEHVLFPMVDDLRKLPVDSPADSVASAEVVVHFVMRSQHLRKSVSEAWTGLATIISKLATNPDSIIGVKRLPAHRPPLAVATAIREQIASHQLDKVTEVNSETLVRIFYIGIREKLDELTREARNTVALIVSEFGGVAKEKVRDLHRDLLMSSMASPERIEKLRKLSWIVLEHPHSSAIIPDCVCIAQSAEGGWQPLLFADDITLVVMPLTPHRLLIGKQNSLQAFNVGEYNSIAANACFDFFLSKEKIDLCSVIEGDLGQSVRGEIDKLVSDKVLEAVASYLTAPLSEQASRLNQINSKFESQNGFSFSLSLNDFGTPDEAEKLSNIITEIIQDRNLGDFLNMLDGFTFSNDYEGTIASLERGFEAQNVIKTTKSALGFGVAIPLTVKRDGKLKTHFVLRGFLADYLLGNDEEDRLSAVATVRYLLAGLSLDYLERTRFSGWMLQRIETPIEDYLYSHSRGVFDTYYSYRLSAAPLNTAYQHMENFEKNIADIISTCVDRRRLYRINSDLDGFLSLAFEQAKLILSHVAKILGSCAEFDANERIQDKLIEILTPFEMTDWLKLFANDLSYFYENLGEWSDFEEIFFVNRHFERWLIVLGIVMQDNGDGQFYAHVPLASDAEYLSQIHQSE